MDGQYVDLGIPGIVEAVAVGSGGVATVYRAVQPQLNRTVAVKVIQGVRDPATVRRFEREASALGSLSEHPGIVTLYSTGTTAADQPYFIMQYCPSGSLQDRVNTHGAMSVTAACVAIAEIATSIGDAHDQGVLHRDLKPANVLIDSLGHYLVADFGIAAITDATAGISTSLSFTAGYVPPEVLEGGQPTAAGDVYSLGATLYALLRAKMPFASDQVDDQNLLALMRRLSTEQIEDVRVHGVPDPVASLIERCMAKDPAQRPSIRELARLATAAAAGADAAVSRPPSPAPEPRGPRFEAVPGSLGTPPVPGAAPPLPVEYSVAPTVPPVAGVVPPSVPPPAVTPVPSPPGVWGGRRAMTAAIAVVAVLFALLGFFVVRALSNRVDASLAVNADDGTERNESAVNDDADDDSRSSDEQVDVEGPIETEDGEESIPARVAGTAGQGGELVLRQWLEPVIANPYMSGSTTDALAGSLVLEPLAQIAPDGTLVPALAVDIPRSGTGISNDQTQITWQLRQDVTWSDGMAFTAADVVFTWQYCIHPDSGCSSDAFDDVVDVVAEGNYAVTLTMNSTGAYPFKPFVGFRSPILQRAQFADCVGIQSSACAAHDQSPNGTGPYVVSRRSTTDTFYALNPFYRGIGDGQPFFDSVVILGGGDAEDAARSVLDTDEADYAWNMFVDNSFRDELLVGGLGVVRSGFASNVEHINLNQTNNRVDGELQSNFNGGANPNPFFFENSLFADALSLAIDRDELVARAYGPAGVPTCNLWNVQRVRSSDTGWCLSQDIDKANDLLDELGYIDTDSDGVRELPDGTPLEFDFVTSTNSVRQQVQELIANDWAEIGVVANMRNEEPSLFFAPDGEASIWPFTSDIVMFTNGPIDTDPVRYFSQWTTNAIPTPDNGWVGFNIPRFSNSEYDELFAQLSTMSIDDSSRQMIVERLDTIVTRDGGATIPLVQRASVSAFGSDIANTGPLNGWDSEYWNIQEWTRDG